MYSCAIKEVRTRFDILDTEYASRCRRNPMHSIQSRMKSTSSIVKKLSKYSVPISLENMKEHIKDIAGVRIICTYIDDVYEIADSFIKQEDITLVSQKDYVKNPKPNGYRSLHLIVEVPVFFAEAKVDLPVEVQIRTIGMDLWASLEHQLKYKKTVPNQQEIVECLKTCAETLNDTDEQMLLIRKQIEEAEDIPTEEEILLERLSQIDIKV